MGFGWHNAVVSYEGRFSVAEVYYMIHKEKPSHFALVDLNNFESEEDLRESLDILVRDLSKHPLLVYPDDFVPEEELEAYERTMRHDYSDGGQASDNM